MVMYYLTIMTVNVFSHNMLLQQAMQCSKHCPLYNTDEHFRTLNTLF